MPVQVYGRFPIRNLVVSERVSRHTDALVTVWATTAPMPTMCCAERVAGAPDLANESVRDAD